MRRLYRWVVNFLETLDWHEIWRYFVVGVGTTLIDIIAFWLMNKKLGINELIANPVGWFFSTAFAFFSNSFYVFRVRPENGKELLSFAMKFYGERIFTLLVEESILLVFVSLLRLPTMPVKICAVLVVIALNFLISKFLIFRKNDSANNDNIGENND